MNNATISSKQLQENFATLAETLGQKYQKAQEEYEKEFETLQLDFVEEYNLNIQEKMEELHQLDYELEARKHMFDAAVEESKRRLALAEQQDFYKLNLSDEDIAEIEKIRSIEPYLRDIEPLNKVIWKVYYEKPYTDLVGRVVGSETKTGIYKITNLINNKCYIGQAVNIADRWRQHIKKGIGADQSTKNKLYPAMKKDGIENFSFEIIEECPREDLDYREDFWQDFFSAKEFGYSIK